MSDQTTASPAARARLMPGDRVPPFLVRAGGNPNFRFDSIAGRWQVLCCAGSLRGEADRARVAAAFAAADLFDDARASLYVLSHDPEDESAGRLTDALPGRRAMWDFDGAAGRVLGSVPADAPSGAGVEVTPFWLVIDPGLTVRRAIPFRADGSDAAELLAYMRALPPPATHLGFETPAPVLILPDVFEPEFCDRLVGLYEAQGGEISGFMRDVGGRTVAAHDPNFKVRRDCMIEDKALIGEVQARIVRRVAPQIERVHYFRCTRMERYMVACYDSGEGGHFRAHRDNTTLGTAHRRFAVSINLNDGFEGGEVSFPEYGPRGYRAPKGGAVIFSCAMLHEVARVRAGRRYAFLPFLYDEAAAAIRERNAANVAGGAGYKA